MGLLAGKLFVVATPIGNLGDISARAVETLSAVDFIAAEDTRVSLTLLQRYGIKARLTSYHKFNEKQRTEGLLRDVLAGQSCALITDAGTPCISDPGSVIVGEAVRAGIEVVGVPGPCAAALALSVSGFNISSYAFYGFPPRGNETRDFLLGVAGDSPNTAVFYESPHRIIATVGFINEVFPCGELCVCNDLTKKFEMIYRGSPGAVLGALQSNENAHKGEYTVALNKNAAPKEAETEVAFSIEGKLADIMAKKGCTLREAMAFLHEADGELSKREIYAASLRLKNLFE